MRFLEACPNSDKGFRGGLVAYGKARAAVEWNWLEGAGSAINDLVQYGPGNVLNAITDPDWDKVLEFIKSPQYAQSWEGGFELLISAGITKRPFNVRGGLVDSVASKSAASIHPGRLAAESGNVSQESIMRALRQSGSVEGAATAKLIKRGDVKIQLVPTDPWRGGAAGRAPFGSDTVYLSLDKLPSPTSAAGVASHETKHVLQKLTPQTYRQAHELPAYQWQRAVDPNFNLSDEAIMKFIQTHPLYRNVPPSIVRGQ